MELGVEREVGAAGGRHLGADLVGDRDHLAGREQVGQAGEAARQAGLDAAALMLVGGVAEAPALDLGQHRVELVEQARDAGREAVDRGADVERARAIAQEPLGAARDREARLAEQAHLVVRSDDRGQQLELAEQRHQAEGVAGDHIGARHRGRRAPGLLAELADRARQAPG